MRLISPSAVWCFTLIISELHLVDLRPSLQFIILRYDPTCQTEKISQVYSVFILQIANNNIDEHQT